jgi:hypothetical protein
MKTIFVLPLVIAFSVCSSCQKQQSDAERQAEIDREVQRRLDAEHQAQEKKQLAQREADINAREKALAQKENAGSRNREGATPLRPDQRPMRPEDRESTASYDTFYTKLEPLGVWRETSEYGYVWQPREAGESRSWRPYTNGHWVYTDAGWTWISEEPFGWATYHYGRWTRLRNVGWVWVPGHEWAPAWVSWRKSDNYVGWAPLPPEARFDRASGIRNWADNYYDIGPGQYCFVPTSELGAPRVEQAIVPPERNLTIVNETINVTNITYNKTTVVNQGPNYEEVRLRAQQSIPRLRLERQVNVNLDNPRPVVRGEVVEIPEPVIGRAQPVERPRSVKETITQAVVDHGWETIADRQAAEKLRMKIKSEATPPPNPPPKTFVKPTAARAETSTTAATSPSTTAIATPGAAVSMTSPTPTAAQRENSAAIRQTSPARQESATPFRSPAPLGSVRPAPTPPGVGSGMPAETPRPTAPMTSPNPLRTPLRAASPVPSTGTSLPEASATASVSRTEEASGPSDSSGFGAAAKGSNRRETAKELRQQGKFLEKQRKKEQQIRGMRPEQQTPPNSPVGDHSLGRPASSSSATASPFLHDGLEPRKQQKKEQKRQRQGVSQPTGSVSPSPATPQ